MKNVILMPNQTSKLIFWIYIIQVLIIEFNRSCFKTIIEKKKSLSIDEKLKVPYQ